MQSTAYFHRQNLNSYISKFNFRVNHYSWLASGFRHAVSALLQVADCQMLASLHNTYSYAIKGHSWKTYIDPVQTIQRQPKGWSSTMTKGLFGLPRWILDMQSTESMSVCMCYQTHCKTIFIAAKKHCWSANNSHCQVYSGRTLCLPFCDWQWCPPKQLKYGKLGLRESTLMQIVLDTPNLV